MPTEFYQASHWRSFGVPLLLLFLTGHAGAEGLSFDAALRTAETTAPQLQARRAAMTSAEEAAPAADALPDPKAFIGIDTLPVDGADRFSPNSDYMTMKKFG